MGHLVQVNLYAQECATKKHKNGPVHPTHLDQSTVDGRCHHMPNWTIELGRRDHLDQVSFVRLKREAGKRRCRGTSRTYRARGTACRIRQASPICLKTSYLYQAAPPARTRKCRRAKTSCRRRLCSRTQCGLGDSLGTRRCVKSRSNNPSLNRPINSVAWPS